MVLSLKSLTIHNGKPVNLAVFAGECVCISGASGSGKTLLMRAIADLDPHEGEVLLGEEESQTMPAHEWRKQVALLPAESHWWFDTVGEHFTKPDPVMLEQVGFSEDVLTWQVKRLSTGEKQRLAIVRLLALLPKALLLDEPTANLDAQNTKIVEALINDYRTKNTAPVLWVSHDPAQIKRVAHRWFQIKEGKLVKGKIKCA